MDHAKVDVALMHLRNKKAEIAAVLENVEIPKTAVVAKDLAKVVAAKKDLRKKVHAVEVENVDRLYDLI